MLVPLAQRLTVLGVLVSFTAAFGDEPPSVGRTASDAPAEFQDYAIQAAESYTLSSGSAQRALEFRKGSILRWSNPLGGRKAHGEFFVWTDRGRPAAVLSLYRYTGPDGVVHEHHEWSSLALESLTADGPKRWSPAQPGIELKAVPEAAAPADTPVRRLRQMRDLAARFSATKTTREGQTTRDLRLLPQPAYRYESADATVLDGALFAFVEATDPEILLVIESRATGSKQAWHFALARMNSVRLEAALDDRPVWVADELAWRDALNRADRTYTAFSIR